MAKYEKVHCLTEAIYKNILDNFNPGVKQLISSGRALQKALHNVAVHAKNYTDCVFSLAQSGQVCKGATSEIGAALVQIAEVHKEINTQVIDNIKSFHSDLLIPLETKQENEYKHLQLIHKKYSTGHKLHRAAYEKSESVLKKHRKKSKAKFGFDQKELQHAREVKENYQKLEDYQLQNLRLVLMEERKRYCFVLDRVCAMVRNYASHHRKAHEMLTHRLAEWSDLSKTPHILPPSSEAVINAFRSQDDLYTTPEEPPGSEFERRSSSDYTENHGDSSSGRGEDSNSFTYGLTTHRLPPGPDIPQPPPHAAHPPPLTPPTVNNLPPPTNPGNHAPQPHYNSHTAAVTNIPGLTNINNHHHAGLSNPQPLVTNGVQSHNATGLDGNHHSTGTTHQQEPRGSELGEPPSGGHVRAMYTHTGSGDTQLDFVVGDMINLIGGRREGWQYGENTRSGRLGWFPISFTEAIPSDRQQNDSQDFRLTSQRVRSLGNLSDLHGDVSQDYRLVGAGPHSDSDSVSVRMRSRPRDAPTEGRPVSMAASIAGGPQILDPASRRHEVAPPVDHTENHHHTTNYKTSPESALPPPPPLPPPNNGWRPTPILPHSASSPGILRHKTHTTPDPGQGNYPATLSNIAQHVPVQNYPTTPKRSAQQNGPTQNYPNTPKHTTHNGPAHTYPTTPKQALQDGSSQTYPTTTKQPAHHGLSHTRNSSHTPPGDMPGYYSQGGVAKQPSPSLTASSSGYSSGTTPSTVAMTTVNHRDHRPDQGLVTTTTAPQWTGENVGSPPTPPPPPPPPFLLHQAVPPPPPAGPAPIPKHVQWTQENLYSQPASPRRRPVANQAQ